MGDFKNGGREWQIKGIPSEYVFTISRFGSQTKGKWRPMASMIWAGTSVG